MLGMKTYSQDYIDACRARVDADLRAYREQVGKAPSREFEIRFFNDQSSDQSAGSAFFNLLRVSTLVLNAAPGEFNRSMPSP